MADEKKDTAAGEAITLEVVHYNAGAVAPVEKFPAPPARKISAARLEEIKEIAVKLPVGGQGDSTHVKASNAAGAAVFEAWVRPGPDGLKLLAR